MKTLRLAAPAALAALALAACGSSSTPAASSAGSASSSGTAGASGTSGASGSGASVPVVVSFYPLQYLTERVGGDRVTVTSLTKPGVEPHDVDLSPADVANAGKAALGIYEKGMQPSVDDAFSTNAPAKVLDVSQTANLDLHLDEDAGEHDDHDDHDASATATQEHEHGGGTDPHFWLDPQRYSKVAAAIATSLGEADPAGKETYATNLAAVQKDLTALDGELRAGLASCTNKNIVTSHAAFGYLARAYGLTQVPIAGLSPEQEPEPKRLAEIAEFVRKNKVSTIYTETLASPAVAKTVATETGAQTAVLDPIEGISATSAAQDYPGLMRANLAALRKGQSCS